MLQGIARQKQAVSRFIQSFPAVLRNNTVIPFKAFTAVCAAAVLSAFAGSYPGPNPSLHQIDSAWRAFYGSPVHQGIVVYNKMTGGTTTDASLDTLCIMRLVNYGGIATIIQLMRYPQWQGMSGWGVSSAYRISPDGSKIAMQNGTAVSVCDTNGANLKVIWTGSLNRDQLNMSWDDSAGIRRLVYAGRTSTTYYFVVRTVVNADNSAGATDTLWNHSWGRDPSAGSSAQQYTSVNKVGNYLCFDMPTLFLNIPVVVNLATRTAVNPTSGGDGCQVRMCVDPYGTVSYHEATHLTHATLWRATTGAVLGYVPCPNGTQTGCTDCGNNMFYWCDSDTNYLIQTGDNQQSASPGCYTKAFIRKGKTTTPPMTMYLGDFLAFPALWIDPAVFSGTINERATPRTDARARIFIRLTAAELILADLEGRVIDNAVLTNVNGAVVARGQGTAPHRRRFAIASVPAGMYILSWRSANVTEARFIVVAR